MGKKQSPDAQEAAQPIPNINNNNTRKCLSDTDRQENKNTLLPPGIMGKVHPSSCLKAFLNEP